jgi:6-phospho-beta-glucosidase
MTEAIKIASIGGGSSYTPNFAEILASLRDELPIKEWVLMDVDKERLNVVAGFTKKLLQSLKLDIKIKITTDLREAVTGADFVFTTIRVGQAQSRIIDETVPLKHGLLGQETTAPGGLLMGLRNIPAMLEIAHAMEELSSPDAWLINLANPSGMLSEALNRHSKVKFAGLCNGPTVVKEVAAGALKADPKDIFIKYMGLNHLVFARVFHKGVDVTEAGLEKFDAWMQENIPPLRTECAELWVQKFAGWFLLGPYLRFYYLLPESIEDHINMASHWPQFLEYARTQFGDLLKDIDISKCPTRAHFVKAIEDVTMELYAEGNFTGYELVKKSRGGRGYAEAGLSLASAIWNDKYEVHGVDVPNNGAFYGLDRRDVVTATAMVNRAGIFPLAMGIDMPRHMLSFIQSAKNYELLAVEAAVTGDYHTALEALIANPLIHSLNQAKGALDELLVAHKAYLPKFAGAIAILEKGGNPLE